MSMRSAPIVRLSLLNTMNAAIRFLLVLSCALPALAIDQAELDDRIRTLTSKFEMLQKQPDKRIPTENLRKAQGIVLMDRTKAGFIFAYQGGGGVAMARDSKDGKWSPVAFLSANEASLGFQVGGEQAFFVLLLMTTNATRLLTEPTFEFGGEARGTAGDASTGVDGKVTSSEPAVLVYSDRKGLYGGAAIKGGAIAPDNDDNRIYYRQPVTMKDILFDKKVKATEAATNLATKIADYSKNAKE
ncbi:MAG TPA: lipid-binding SYLF domain-containing protein [Candidatus Nitrosotalea sp.]|nr:lipid-binding SYLF domain-containing protein [Candidatus Nitrosotalea sp.]